MLFSGKENVLMCLVVFQKIFRKIFSGVWKMLQGKDKPRKTQTKPRLTLDARLGSTARCCASSSPTTAPLIAISRSTAPIAISDRDRRRWCLRTAPTRAWCVRTTRTGACVLLPLALSLSLSLSLSPEFI